LDKCSADLLNLNNFTKFSNSFYEIPSISKSGQSLSEQQLDSYAELGFKQSQDCPKHPKSEKLVLVMDNTGIRKKIKSGLRS
jgi:hypothetical protein